MFIRSAVVFSMVSGFLCASAANAFSTTTTNPTGVSPTALGSSYLDELTGPTGEMKPASYGFSSFNGMQTNGASSPSSSTTTNK